MSNKIERLGKGKCPVIGPYIIVGMPFWCSERQKTVISKSLFPRNQWAIRCHPRHPTGFDMATGKRNASVAPSCSFYGDLLKYGGFIWDDPKKIAPPETAKAA